MFWIVIALSFAAAAATLLYLVRGLAAFLRSTEASLNDDGTNSFAHAQNKAMQGRVVMQGLAVLLALLALSLAS
jgi:hypothetical protein